MVVGANEQDARKTLRHFLDQTQISGPEELFSHLGFTQFVVTQEINKLLVD